jgi:hypothetical protein
MEQDERDRGSGSQRRGLVVSRGLQAQDDQGDVVGGATADAEVGQQGIGEAQTSPGTWPRIH